MNIEENKPDLQQEEKLPAAPEAAEPQELPEPLTSKQKTRPVVFYIGIMFIVALFLIILSFFMQQRNHEALLKGISGSAVSAQMLVDLEREKDVLQEAYNDLQLELETTQRDKEALSLELQALAPRAQALEYLQAAALAYAEDNSKQARELLTLMQEKKLHEALPTETTIGAGKSPRESFDLLLEKLN